MSEEDTRAKRQGIKGQGDCERRLLKMLNEQPTMFNIQC